MKKRLICFIVTFSMFITGMLSYSAPAEAAKAPKLNKKSIQLVVKKTQKLKVLNTKAKITWKSSNKKIATVTKKGVVKGIKKGTTKVSATFKLKGKKKTLKCTVKVINKKTASSTKKPTTTNKPTVSPTVTPTVQPSVTPEPQMFVVSGKVTRSNNIFANKKMVFRETNDTYGYNEKTVVTDAAGHYSISLTSGVYKVKIVGISVQQIKVEKANLSQDFEVKAFIISGKVTSGGSFVSGSPVWLLQGENSIYTATTDSTGQYEVYCAENGTYQVSSDRKSKEVVVNGADVKDIDFEVILYTISGVVYDKFGAIIPNKEVLFFNGDFDWETTVKTDAEGKYSIELQALTYDLI